MNPHGALLTIDLGALAANWQLLRDRVAPAECAAVVKADAYGIGIEPAVPVLRKAGCRTFFVAHLGEAARLRAVAPEAVVYVLNGLPPDAAPSFVEVGARPVLGSPEELADWAAESAARRERLPAALHVDTGMNRLGLPIEAATQVASSQEIGAIAPTLLMSHLVSAEDWADDDVTRRQAEQFDRLRAAFPGVPASLANSSGIFHPDVKPLDLVRPGYALYGGNPTPGAPNPMRPVVRLEAEVVQARSVETGERVGYNGCWTAPGPRRLATLSCGYADGFPRAAGHTDASRHSAGSALIRGRLCPMVGRVSMDLIVVDVTEVQEAGRGDRATLIGDALDLDEVGRRAGTIGYEILTGLGRRYARRYVEG